jgi:SpoVK/Ycf46/Vps4 family AAA+-type ATPase
LKYKLRKKRDLTWKNPRHHHVVVTPCNKATVYGFTLAGESQWYVTDNWIVTHNTGKSMGAKALGKEWGVPLLHLDVGKIMSGIVGSSEARMREAIKTAEAVAPCILWVDEIEKGLSGTGSSNFSDGGTMSRVFGTFLTWMQEKTADVFIVATANDITQLPDALKRKGRFDEIFFVDLPGAKEREQIFAIHIAKRKHNPEDFDLPLLAKESDGFSGAEIENAVKDAMYIAFNTADRKLTTHLVLAEIKKTTPLLESMKDKIDGIKKEASNMRFASSTSKHSSMSKLSSTKIESHSTRRKVSSLAEDE